MRGTLAGTSARSEEPLAVVEKYAQSNAPDCEKRGKRVEGAGQRLEGRFAEPESGASAPTKDTEYLHVPRPLLGQTRWPRPAALTPTSNLTFFSFPPKTI